MRKAGSSWKVFRLVCIVQMVLVAFQLMLSFTDIFFAFHLSTVFRVLTYTAVFVFLYQGLSLLNYNYPDIPLTVRQKRTFNWLFIINVLLITYLFAAVVNTWWIILLLLNPKTEIGRFNINLFYLLAPFLLTSFIFLFHLVFLAGMFRLRRTIHQNTIKGWYNQFEENKQE